MVEEEVEVMLVVAGEVVEDEAEEVMMMVVEVKVVEEKSEEGTVVEMVVAGLVLLV